MDAGLYRNRTPGWENVRSQEKTRVIYATKETVRCFIDKPWAFCFPLLVMLQLQPCILGADQHTEVR